MFKLEDKVHSKALGWGVVTSILDNTNYSVIVTFTNGIARSFLVSGHYTKTPSSNDYRIKKVEEKVDKDPVALVFAKDYMLVITKDVSIKKLHFKDIYKVEKEINGSCSINDGAVRLSSKHFSSIVDWVCKLESNCEL